MLKRIFITLLLLLPFSLLAQDGGFPLPDVPATLKGPEARANYLALHYWDRYDFNDLTLIGNKDISEQGFSNFISIMPYVTQKDTAMEQFALRISGNGRMLRYFMALGEKYLAEPLSPLYDEELYIMLLEKAVALPAIEERDRQQYTFDLSMASKNRVGTEAADFGFMTRDGRHSRLSRLDGEYILLFLGDPECDVCTITKNELLSSPNCLRFIKAGRMKVLSVCVEGKTEAWTNTPAPEGWIDACDEKEAIYDELLYEIPGLPALYLLDGEKRVLLKNVPVRYIENYLKDK